MCLSTVYKNKKTDDSIVMKNVMSIECKDGLVILTDLMERQVAIEGTLEPGGRLRHCKRKDSCIKRQGGF